VIDGTGSYGAVLTEQLVTAGFQVAEAPDVPAHVRRAAGKTDTLEIARAARGLTPQQLRRPHYAGDRTILRVLTCARDQMTGERTRTVNALTALLRTVELGIDARRALSAATIATIAAWRTQPTPRRRSRRGRSAGPRQSVLLDASARSTPT
jgi:hypothetical protein